MQLSVNNNSFFVFSSLGRLNSTCKTHRLWKSTLKLHRVNLTSVQLLYLGCDLDIKGCLSRFYSKKVQSMSSFWDWLRSFELSKAPQTVVLIVRYIQFQMISTPCGRTQFHFDSILNLSRSLQLINLYKKVKLSKFRLTLAFPLFENRLFMR